MENRLSTKQLNTVMLIDDNFIDNFVHKRLLTSIKVAGNFLEFTKAEDALEYIKAFNSFSSATSGKSIDLILLDINMPMMDGWAFLERLKQICNNKKPDTAIIVLSSSANKDDAERARAEVFLSGFIQKPLTLEKLSNCFGSIKDSAP